MMDYTEKAIRHVNSYHGVVVDVTADIVSLPGGGTSVREVVHHPGGVCIAAVDGDGNIYVERQFRYPFGKHLTELPAGKLEKGEDPFEAAQRELSEETGLTAGEWTKLGSIYVSPGISTEELHLYLARDLHQGQTHLDPNEFLDVEKMPLSQLLDRITAGDIHDAKTVVGALRAAAFLARN